MKHLSLSLIKKIVYIIVGILIIAKMLGFNTNVYAYTLKDGNDTVYLSPKIPSMQYSTFNWYVYKDQMKLFDKLDQLQDIVLNSDNSKVFLGVTFVCEFGYVNGYSRNLINLNTSRNSSNRCYYFIYDQNDSDMTLNFNIPRFSFNEYSSLKGNNGSIRPNLLSISYSKASIQSSYWQYASTTYPDIFSMNEEEFLDYKVNTWKPLIDKLALNGFSSTSSSGGTRLYNEIFDNSSVEYFDSTNLYPFDFFIYYSDRELTSDYYPQDVDYVCKDSDLKNTGSFDFDAPTCSYDGEISTVENNYYVNNKKIQDYNEYIPTVRDWIYSISPDEVLSDSSGAITEETKTDPDYLGTLTDSTAPPGQEDFVNGAVGWLPQGPIDSVLNLPLQFLNGYSTAISGDCISLSVNLPFVNKELKLECFNETIQKIPNANNVWNLAGIIGATIILLNYLIHLYKWVDDTLTFRENNEPGYFDEP